MSFDTISVRHDGPVCFVRMERGAEGNTLNDRLVSECSRALAACGQETTIVVLEGTPEVFCLGADFRGLSAERALGRDGAVDPEPLYALWRSMATGPFVTISHVRGRASAGGMGFVAASDLVLADQTAQFSLSEMLFGLFPACVLPFLVRKIGFQKSHYLTLTTQPVSVEKAHEWGLVDAWESASEPLLRKHLMRLRVLSKEAIARYKGYVARISTELDSWRQPALAANREMFSDRRNLDGIARYVEQGKFPWED